MSKKNKLERFDAIGKMPNVYQNTSYHNPQLINFKAEPVDMKGNWLTHFKNDLPIVLELACGKGEYSVNIAKDFNKNTIGVDIKGNRMYIGAKKALEENISNCAFLRTQIDYLDSFFNPGELSEIWILFADPQLGKPRKRLSAKRYLDTYKKLLKNGGIFHIKTDSPELYEFSLESLQENGWKIIYHNDDIYSQEELYCPELSYKTYYESMHLQNNKTIKYIRAKWED